MTELLKVYRIKHNPTGLFYIPSRNRNKTCLSKNGKLYVKKPTLKHIQDVQYINSFGQTIVDNNLDNFTITEYSFKKTDNV